MAAVHEFVALRLAWLGPWSSLIERDIYKQLRVKYRDLWRTYQTDRAWVVPDEIAADAAIEDIVAMADDLGPGREVLDALWKLGVFPSESQYLQFSFADRSALRVRLAEIEALRTATPNGVLLWEDPADGLPYVIPPGPPETHPLISRVNKSYVQRTEAASGIALMAEPSDTTPFTRDFDGLTGYRVNIPVLGKQTRVWDNYYILRLETWVEHLAGDIRRIVGDAIDALPDSPTDPVSTSSIESLARFLAGNGHLPFRTFVPRSVNFGIWLGYKQIWQPLAYQAGELVKTLPLAPGETRKYSTRTTRTQQRKEKELARSLHVIGDESSDIRGSLRAVAGHRPEPQHRGGGAEEGGRGPARGPA